MDGAKKSGKNVRVVSMPSWELFEEQDDAYKQSVLPKEVENRVSLEVRPRSHHLSTLGSLCQVAQ